MWGGLGRPKPPVRLAKAAVRASPPARAIPCERNRERRAGARKINVPGPEKRAVCPPGAGHISEVEFIYRK